MRFCISQQIFVVISIHKALAGLDSKLSGVLHEIVDFNPQGPRGPRPSWSAGWVISSGFQSTRPSRASTVYLLNCSEDISDFNPQGPRGPRPGVSLLSGSSFGISIHKALAGLDHRVLHVRPPKCTDFNPQGPRGPRRQLLKRLRKMYQFQSTRPSRASTVC